MFFMSGLAKDRLYGERRRLVIPKNLGKIEAGALKVTIRKTKSPPKIKASPIPLHDFMNFKKMTSNEILLNLDNSDNLRNSELVGGLIELANRDKNKEHDWNSHPITA